MSEASAPELSEMITPRARHSPTGWVSSVDSGLLESSEHSVVIRDVEHLAEIADGDEASS